VMVMGINMAIVMIAIVSCWSCGCGCDCDWWWWCVKKKILFVDIASPDGRNIPSLPFPKSAQPEN
jgi:hypothetical protein